VKGLGFKGFWSVQGTDLGSGYLIGDLHELIGNELDLTTGGPTPRRSSIGTDAGRALTVTGWRGWGKGAVYARDGKPGNKSMRPDRHGHFAL